VDSRGSRNPDQNRRRVHTYVKPDRFLAHVAALREFLHRFGRETNQEVVVIELSGAEGSWFFRIKEYDE
jgi:hypothetical protein